MSRNLCRTDCHRCQADVAITSSPRRLTRADAGVYLDDFDGMVVADAVCEQCGAKYLAWLGGIPWRKSVQWPPRVEDLSYSSTFNDEPGPDDLPPWQPDPVDPTAGWHWNPECGGSFVHSEQERCVSVVGQELVINYEHTAEGVPLAIVADLLRGAGWTVKRPEEEAYDSDGDLMAPTLDGQDAPCLWRCPAKRASGRVQVKCFPRDEVSMARKRAEGGRMGVDIPWRHVVTCYCRTEES